MDASIGSESIRHRPGRGLACGAGAELASDIALVMLG